MIPWCLGMLVDFVWVCFIEWKTVFEVVVRKSGDDYGFGINQNIFIIGLVVFFI